MSNPLIDLQQYGQSVWYDNMQRGMIMSGELQNLIDNDGLRGMVEKSGSILLGAGLHAIRVEFFERGGGAGCIVRIEGGGLEKQVVPDSIEELNPFGAAIQRASLRHPLCLCRGRSSPSRL